MNAKGREPDRAFVGLLVLRCVSTRLPLRRLKEWTELFNSFGWPWTKGGRTLLSVRPQEANPSN